MMPMIGRLLQKGVKQQYLVAGGMFIFFIYSFWGYKIITPDTAKGDFFWMLIVRGVGMGMLFIPISTLSLSTLKGQQIGQGAAFTGMMRQLGGSFGIALIATLLSRKATMHKQVLASHITSDNPVAMARIQGMQHNFIAKGDAANVALAKSYKIMDYTLAKQSMVLSYMDAFLYIGIMFLICMPFVLLVRGRKSKEKIDLSEAMH